MACNRAGQRVRQIEQIARAICKGRDWNLAGVYALGRSRSLVIGEEKDRALSDRAAEGSAKLILVKCAAGRGEIVAGVEVRVTQKFERVAMKLVGARFCDHVDLSAAVASVFCVEVAGKDAELGNGVEIRNDRSARVHVFFGVAAIHDEGIRKLALAVDRNRSRIKTAGGRKRADADVLLCV